jgi:hypothetical protein
VEQPERESAVSARAADLVVAVLIFAVGAVVIWDSARLGAKWGPDGPEAGYFPFYIGLLLCLSSAVNFVRAWMMRGSKPFVAVAQLKAVVSVVLPTIVYVLLIGGAGPLPRLGIYVASALFIALFMRWLGKYGWFKTMTVSIAVPAAFFVLFEIWFKVPLPKGPLEAALGFA